MRIILSSALALVVLGLAVYLIGASPQPPVSAQAAAAGQQPTKSAGKRPPEGKPAAPGRQGPPPPVAVSEVIERAVESSRVFVGTVMPLKTSVIGSAVDGRVVEFPIDEGDRVEKGQPLAQLLTDTLSLQLKVAEAELMLRQKELLELKNGTRPEEVREAEARRRKAEALKDYGQARHARFQELYDKGRTATKEQLDEALSIALGAEQSFKEAEAAYDLAIAGPRVEKIAQAEAAAEAQAQQVELLKDQLKKHTIISPFDGYVIAEHTEVGQWLNRGELVADVVYLDQVDVLVHVLEDHVPYLRVGMPVHVEVPAVAGKSFQGEVALIVPQADVRSRTFPVKVRVTNEIQDNVPLLKSGMLARVTLPTGGHEQACLVPKDALVLGGPQPVVCVVDAPLKEGSVGAVRMVPLTLGMPDGHLIEAHGDLKRGDVVVVQGNERLPPGVTVRIGRVLPPGAGPKVQSTER